MRPIISRSMRVSSAPAEHRQALGPRCVFSVLSSTMPASLMPPQYDASVSVLSSTMPASQFLAVRCQRHSASSAAAYDLSLFTCSAVRMIAMPAVKAAGRGTHLSVAVSLSIVGTAADKG
jgi:hypothetical protein